MKTQDTEAALDRLAGSAHRPGAVACAQNGVENERLALRRFADVHAVCVMCPATHLEPGVVQASSAPVSGILDVGRYPSGIDAATTALADALGGSTFVSEVRPDIMRWKYSKLLMNLGNVVQAAFAPSARPPSCPGGPVTRVGPAWRRPASTWPARPRRTASGAATC